MPTCMVNACSKPARRGMLCGMHDMRRRRTGSFDITRRANGTGNINKDGYVDVRVEGVRTYEHISVVERVLGRELRPGVIVHHANENRQDNRNENLVVCPDEAYHRLLHIRMRALAETGNANLRKCSICKTYDDPSALRITRRGAALRIFVRHEGCERQQRRDRDTRPATK